MAAPSPSQRVLRQVIRRAASQRVTPPGHAYGTPQEFVLRHGEWYEPKVGPAMAPRQCFMNALAMAVVFGWTYVEGYALPPQGRHGSFLFLAGDRQVVPHAWAVDSYGAPLELTWPVPGRAYLGVQFSAERAWDGNWNGDANVLQDDQREYPVLRDAWERETFPPERSEMMRHHAHVLRIGLRALSFREPGIPNIPPGDYPTKEEFEAACREVRKEAPDLAEHLYVPGPR